MLFSFYHSAFYSDYKNSYEVFKFIQYSNVLSTWQRVSTRGVRLRGRALRDSCNIIPPNCIWDGNTIRMYPFS